MNKKNFLGAPVLFLCVAGANGMDFNAKLTKVSTIGGIDLSKVLNQYAPLVAQTRVGRELFYKLIGKITGETSPQKELSKQETGKLQELVVPYEKVYGRLACSELAELLVQSQEPRRAESSYHKLELRLALAYDLGVDDNILQIIIRGLGHRLAMEEPFMSYIEDLRRLRQEKVQKILRDLRDQKIRWDLEYPVLKRQIPFDKSVTLVAVSNNAQYLAGVEDDGTITIRDLNSGELLGAFTHEGPVAGLAFSQDSSKLAVFSRQENSPISIFDVVQKITKTIPFDGEINMIAWGNHGLRIVVVLNKKRVVVFDDLGLEKMVFDGTSTSRVSTVVFTPDDTGLVIGYSYGPVTLLDLKTCKSILVAGHDRLASSIACSPDGKYIALALGGTCELFDRASGKLLREIPDAGNRLEFSPDAKWLVTYKASTYANINMYSIPDCTLKHELSKLGNVRTSGFSNDGKHLITISDAIYNYRKKDYESAVTLTQLYCDTINDYFTICLQKEYNERMRDEKEFRLGDDETPREISLSSRKRLDKNLGSANTAPFKVLAKKFGTRPARIIYWFLGAFIKTPRRPGSLPGQVQE
jgi:hypothetical protein